MTSISLLSTFFVFLWSTGSGFSQSQAVYSITFNSSWNESDHGLLPQTAHWSDLVGATHNSDVKFWELGQLASPGIEDVAEMGNNANLYSEVNAAIADFKAGQWLQAGFSPFAAISSATLSDVVVDSEFPLLSLVSMVAPSPDWFIGLESFSLLDAEGNWKSYEQIDLFVYDAGTEEGDSYLLNNPDTNPAVPIFSRIDISPFNDQKIGTLTIILDEVLSTANTTFDRSVIIAPNPASGAIRIHNGSGFSIEAIEIFSSIGERLMHVEFDGNSELIEIDRVGLGTGIFLVRMTSENNVAITRKLVLK